LFSVFFVRGDQRVGLYAIEDIAEQSELTFDYNYHTVMDNDLLALKPPVENVEWMKKKTK
jgi:SET domain-containing protein